MLEKLRSFYKSRKKREQKLLLVALAIAILFGLKTTVWDTLSGMEKQLGEEIGQLEFQLEHMNRKVARHGDLRRDFQRLSKRINRESDLLLPFDTALNAQNHIIQRLQQLALQAGVELKNRQPRPVRDAGDHYQIIEVQARLRATTRRWAQFLYLIEAHNLPLTVSQLSIRPSRSRKLARQADITINVSGIIRKPQETS